MATAPIKHFTEWALADAEAAVKAAKIAAVGTEEAFNANYALVEEGDHWRKGEAWVGPRGGEAARSTVLAAVQRQLTPVDATAEGLENVANGLLQREPGLTFAPFEPAGTDEQGQPTGQASDEQQAEIDAMTSWLSAWWDRVKLWERARAAVKRGCWAGYGTLRAWVASRHLQSVTQRDSDGRESQVTQLPTNLPFDQALVRVQLEAPEPADAVIHTDPDTQERCAVFLFTDASTQKRVAEIWFIDEDANTGGKTVCRVLRDGMATEEHRLELAGHLPINAVEMEVLVTDAVRRQQNRLNFGESILVRSIETSGFRERYTTNAKPQGIWMESAPTDGPALDAQTDATGKTWYLHPTVRTLGASITTDLYGIDTTDPVTGKGSVATPGITFADPTDPEFAIKAARHAKRTLLESMRQGHLTTESTAESSGLAYVQARAAFQSDLENRKGPTEGLIRDTIEAVVAYAALMSNDPLARTFLERYRCVVDLHPNAGPVSPDERRAIMEMAEKGFISWETAQAWLGVEDTAAEQSAIDAELGSMKRKAEIFAILQPLGDAKGAAKIAGFTDEQITALMGEPVVQQ
jgi:hypothetical protein